MITAKARVVAAVRRGYRRWRLGKRFPTKGPLSAQEQREGCAGVPPPSAYGRRPQDRAAFEEWGRQFDSPPRSSEDVFFDLLNEFNPHEYS